MKKEVIVAVILGMILGLVITFGIYQARTSLVPKPEISPLDSTPAPLPSESLGSLVVTSPEDESITDQSQVTVAGTTQPDSFVAVTINDQPFITTADASGNFSIQDELAEGSNVIQVLSINSDGQTVKQELTVIYTQELLVDEQPEAATSSADSDS